ncbi:MAG: transcription initiation factor IIB [Candidatus Jordarchaeales archaeon]
MATEQKCPECGSTNIAFDYNTGESVCTGCGLVLDEQMLDTGPEWRAFTAEEREERSRVGMPALYSVHDKGLSTTISRIEEDAFGKKLPQSTRIQMWRLRKWQMRSRAYGSEDRNLAQASAELERICDKLHIPQSVKERAAVIYRKALEKDLVRGRSINAITCAALYAACRSGGVPRTAKEIAEASLAEKKDVMRCYRLILKNLDVKVPIPDPVACVSKIAEPLGISGEVQGHAVEILRRAREKRETCGKEPMGLAAAALYIACQQMGIAGVTQGRIADVAGVTEVTIRNRYKSLKRSLGLKLPKPRKVF